MPGGTSSGARRHCPKCAAPMWPMELQNVEVDLCVKCQGMWFDRGELAKASGTEFQEAASAETLRGGRRPGRSCPDCAVPLYEHELVAESDVMIDQCPRCSGLFLDKGEYSAAQGYLRAKGWRGRRRRERYEMPAQVSENSVALVVFQYVTGLPIELYQEQKLFSPIVTVLVAINVTVLVLAYIYGFADYVKELAMVPREVVAGERLETLLTAMFMHAGVAHLLGNMYFLFVTGDDVEGRFGWLGFLGLYLLCGLVASVAHIFGTGHPELPCLGASGAISGVLGAYMVLFPHSRFLLRWLIYFRPVRLELPAYAYFGLWILLQLIYAGLGIRGVAWWAHIGGFVCGVLVALGARAYEHSRAKAA